MTDRRIHIKSRWSPSVIYTSAAGATIKEAVEEASRAGVDLSGASLGFADLAGADLEGVKFRSANLEGANLIGVKFRSADLEGANLIGANLRTTDLRSADLRSADLRSADLEGANLRCADLIGANLRCAKINWQSHDLIAALLRQAADDDVEKRKVAGLVLVSRDWCWDEFGALIEADALSDWALDVLVGYMKGGDNAPKILRDHKASQMVMWVC